MHITFVMPAIGREEGKPYLKTWQMEPLPLAQLAGMTPKKHTLHLFDDRLEDINYTVPTDVVAITVETYTAKRAYEIASGYTARGVVVVMGGFHATLMTDEVKQHADIVVVGEAESVWGQVLADIESGTYNHVYRGDNRPLLAKFRPNRKIFKGKRYLPITLIESARGCKFACSFCSIAQFYKSTYKARPVEDVVKEVRETKSKNIFFIDDNFTADLDRAKALCQALIPMNIRWVGQASLLVSQDKELLGLMQASGCQGILIGFESLNPKSLLTMNKQWNQRLTDYHVALAELRQHGIAVYASFIFGTDEDRPKAFETTYRFAIKEQFFLAAFNHLVPFPGTPLFTALKEQKRLFDEAWWLSPKYHFGDVVYNPKHFTARQLTRQAIEVKRRFYSLKSIYQRINRQNNCKDGFMFRQYILLNLLFRKEVGLRPKIAFGKR